MNPFVTEFKASPRDLCMNLEQFEEFIARYRITSTLGHMVSFIKARSIATKFAYIVCIAETYQTKSLLKSVDELAAYFPLIEEFFKFCVSKIKGTPLEQEVPELPTFGTAPPDMARVINTSRALHQVIQQSAPTLNLAEFMQNMDKEENTDDKSLFSFLNNNMSIVRPVIGFACFLACAFGFTELLNVGTFSTFSFKLVELAKVINAKNTVTKQINTTIDEVLKSLYSMAGKTYYSDKEIKLTRFSKTLDAVTNFVRSYAERSQTDFLGVLRTQNIQQVRKLYREVELMFNAFTAEDKNNLNFVARMQNLNELVELVYNRYVMLLSSHGRKQQPVRLWMFGEPGHGKTYASLHIARVLSEPKGGIYQRSCLNETSQDTYWNNYCGQPVVIFDDILQGYAGTDATEWHRFASDNNQSVTMAGMQEKGIPFSSQYMIATSNKAYVKDMAAIANPESFNRRRDFLVYVYNQAYTDYKAEHNGAQPPRSFFENHPPRYFMYSSLSKNAKNKTEVRQPRAVPNQNDPDFLGEVTLEELIYACKEMEKANAEALRKFMLTIPGLREAVHIPETPYVFDEKAFMFEEKFAVSKWVADRPVTNAPDEPRQNEDKTAALAKIAEDAVRLAKTDPTTVKMSDIEAKENTEKDTPTAPPVEGGEVPEKDNEAKPSTSGVKPKWRCPAGLCPLSEKKYCVCTKEDSWETCSDTDATDDDATDTESVESSVEDQLAETRRRPKRGEVRTVPRAKKQANYVPITPIVSVFKHAVILLGPPGIGKSFMLNGFDQKCVKYEPAQFAQAKTDNNRGKIVLFDDFTTSEEACGIAREMLVSFNSGESFAKKLGWTGFILSGNPLLQTWKNKDTREMMSRRSAVINIDLSFKTKAQHALSKKSVAEILAPFSTNERDSKVSVSATSVGWEMPANFFNKYSALPQHLREWFGIDFDSLTKVKYQYSEFSVPMPPDESLDYRIVIPLTWREINEGGIVKQHESTITKFTNGVERVATTLEVAQLVLYSKSFLNSGARGKDPRDFVRTLNEEEHKVRLPTIHFVSTDYQVVIYSIEFEGGHRTIAANIDTASQDVVGTIGDEVFINASRFTTDEHNARFREGLKKLFNTQEVERRTQHVRRAPAEQEEMERELRLNSPLGVFAQLAVTAISLILRLGASVALVYSLTDEFSHCSHKTEEECIAESRTASLKANLARKAREDEAQEEDPAEYNGNATAAAPTTKAKKEDVEDESRKGKQRAQQVRAARDKEAEPDDQAEYDGNAAASSKGTSASKETRKGAQRAAQIRDTRRDNAPEEEDKAEYDGNGAAPSKGCGARKELYSNDVTKKTTKTTAQKERINQDATLMFNAEAGVYGFIFNGQIWHAVERGHRGHWFIMCVPVNPAWEVLDVNEEFPSVVKNHNKFKVAYKQRAIDGNVLMPMLAATYTLDSKIEFSSVFASAFCFGVPVDAVEEKLMVNLMTKVFLSFKKPAPMMGYLEKAFPATHKALLASEEIVISEGCYDPAMRQATVDISKCMFEIHSAGGEFQLQGLVVKGNQGITVGHIAEGSTIFRDGKEFPITITGHSKSLDICTFQVPSPQWAPVKSMMHHLMTENDLSRVITTVVKEIPAVLVTRAPKDTAMHLNYCNVTPQVTPRTSVHQTRGRTGVYSATLNSLISTGVSLAGDCGSPLLILDRKSSGKIAGIHRAGSNVISVCAYITREWVEEMFASPETAFKYSNDGAVQVESNTVLPHSLTFDDEVVSTTVSPTCITMCERNSVDSRVNLMQVGKTDRAIYIPDSTKLKTTGIKLPEEFGVFEPSVMSNKDPRVPEDTSMFLEGIKRYGNDTETPVPDQDFVDDTMTSIGKDLATIFKRERKDVRILTKTEAINGPPTEEYPRSRPLDRNGSAGVPWILDKTSQNNKGDFLYFNEKTQRWVIKTDTARGKELHRCVDRLLLDAREDSPHVVPFVAYLKDEPVKMKKVYTSDRKTRIFFSGPFEYLLAYRIYFGAAMFRITETFHHHPIKVGISDQMKDWHMMTAQLRSYGTHAFASDVASFDSNVHQNFLKGVCKVYDQIYGQCTNDPTTMVEQSKIRRALHYSIEGAYVLAMRKCFKLKQAQVSGHPGTAVENSMIMWCLYAMCFISLAKIYDPTKANYAAFKDNVKLAVYGDDNICTVKDGCPWFNFNSFAKQAHEFGFNITDAAKTGGEIPDYNTLEELEFLKRRFITVQGWYMGPLLTASVGKSLTWTRSDAESYVVQKEHVPSLGGQWPIANNEYQIASTIENAYASLALQGKEEYYRLAGIIQEAIIASGRLRLLTTLPTWAEMCALKGYTVSETA